MFKNKQKGFTLTDLLILIAFAIVLVLWTVWGFVGIHFILKFW